MNYVKSLNLFGIEAKEIPCITGSGAPTTATVGAVGLFYMNTNNGDVYKCTAVSGSTYTWAPMETASSDSGGNGDQSGLTTAQIEALHGMFKVCAYDDSKDVSGAYAAFKTAFGITDESGGEEEPDIPVTPDEPEKTLSSISATYSGGDVAVGTAVTALTGVVVTAHYSDGSTETVTGYTLSGTIAEGSNTVTVSYGGKTATFTVTGVIEENDEPVTVEMTEYFQLATDGSTYYADGGTTEYTGVKPPAAGVLWCSDMVEEDTKVNVTILYGINNNNLRQYCGCISQDVELATTGVNRANVYYVEQIGTASAEAYTAQYTVRAGYRLAIINYNAGKPQSIAVTK